MNKPGNIEELYKNTFDGYEADVSPEAWDNIEQALHGNVPSGDASSAATTGKLSGGLIAGGSAVLVAVVAGLLYMGAGGPEGPVAHSNDQEVTAVIEPPLAAKSAPGSLESAPIATMAGNAHAPSLALTDKTNEKASTGLEINKNQAASGEYFTASNEMRPLPRQEADVLGMTAILSAPVVSNPVAVNRTQPASPIKEKTQPAESEEAIAMPAAPTEYIAHRLDYPNVITPNGDGKNEIFVIESDYILTLQVQVLNMTGKIIHQWSSLHGFWDGRLENGDLAPEGKYLINIFAIREDGLQVREQPLTLVLKR